MEEIGLEGHGISPVAASEPFPLFTTDAIKQIGAEILVNQSYVTTSTHRTLRRT